MRIHLPSHFAPFQIDPDHDSLLDSQTADRQISRNFQRFNHVLGKKKIVIIPKNSYNKYRVASIMNIRKLIDK